MGDVVLDALIDTLWLVPFLLVFNLLIEFLEHRTEIFGSGKVLKGPLAPLLGSAVGIVPQCGFSVVATELYAERKIALGSLLAVYLATSDEALPIMLSSGADGVKKILPLFLIKLAVALAIGYSVYLAQYFAQKRKLKSGEAPSLGSANEKSEHEHGQGSEQEHGQVHCHAHGCSEECEKTDYAAMTGKQKAGYIWREYIKHPLIHTGTIVLFVFIVNLIFGTCVHFIGEDRISAFLERAGYWQPVLAAVVGIIPNCAASVVITELYVVGGLNLGGAVAGLCMCAGISYAVLAKQNKPVKNTVIVIAVMFAVSVLAGIAVNAVCSAIG